MDGAEKRGLGSHQDDVPNLRPLGSQGRGADLHRHRADQSFGEDKAEGVHERLLIQARDGDRFSERSAGGKG